MAMIVDIVWILVGVVLVLKGADRLTSGASGLARRMRVPEIIIGLTVVAAGTSAPELFVSLVSALRGTPDLAVGNVVGSNTMNTLLIVGAAAVVTPMAITRQTVRRDIPVTLLASLLLVVLCLDGCRSVSIEGNLIGRLDGAVLLLGFAAFMAYTLRLARQGAAGAQPEEAAEQLSVGVSVFYVLIGLVGLILGSNLFVDAATHVATTLGVSQGVIGLTIVAGGTSLPELATSVVAARKGQSAIAIGNVIGSNVFNILLILGLTAVVSPMQIGGITLIDMLVMLLSAVVVWLFSYTKFTIARWEGVLLLLAYGAYLAWLLSNV